MQPAGSVSPESAATRDSAAGSPLSAHIEHNIESIVALQRKQLEAVGDSQRRLEDASNFFARPTYFYLLLTLIIAWVTFNAGARMLGATPWDTPPFAWLGLAMTFISVLTTTIVLIGQNRQTKLEQQHMHLDLQVNLLTEQKVSKLISMVEELRRDLPMVKDRHDPQVDALQERADTAVVLSAIEEVGLTDRPPDTKAQS